MHTISLIDPSLYAKAVQKQNELWDRIIDVLSGEWERGFSRTWSASPDISLEEVMGDLKYGRD